MFRSANRRWLVTADQGDDCAMIVWDTHSGRPVRTYFADQVRNGTSIIEMQKIKTENVLV